MKPLHLHPSKAFKGLIIALVISVACYLLGLLFLTEIHARLLGAVALMVALWSNEALPLGVVSLLPVVIFPALGIMETQQTAGNYANAIIFLFLGGFMLAIAVERAGVHRLIARRMLRLFPATPRGAIYGLCIISGLLSAMLSNTTTALLLLPLANFMADDIPLRMRFALAIAFGSSVGGIITPIGTPPNLILLGYLEANGLDIPSFIEWMVLTTPLAIIMMISMAAVLSIGSGGYILCASMQDHEPVTPAQWKLIIVIGTLALLLILNSPIKPWYGGLGLDERSLILAFGLLMFLPGFSLLDWTDTRKIPYEIIFLFGAGFSLAMAFSVSGFDQVVANGLNFVVGGPMVIALFAIAIFVTFATGVMSNTALISIALPVTYALALQSHLDSEVALMVATIAASYAFMLPISTPPNAIAMASGSVRVGQMASYGILFNIIGAVLLVAIAMLYWSWFL